jgi:hypothetical protein
VKRIVFASFALTPGIALAQVPTNPGQPTAPADAPTNLNPSLPGNQGPPPATPPPAARPQRQPVIVVGPDGTVKQVDAPDPGPGGYYIGGGDTYTEPTVIHSGPTPELHVVRSGDTLWDICWYYFNDPWQWPKIWSYNPQITNPHWIYPGDLVRLLPRGTFVGQPDPEPDRRVDPVPAPQRRIESSVTTTAFVEKPELDTAIVIDGAVDEKTLLGTGDEVYLSYNEKNPPQVGKKYSIYIPGREVKYNQKNFGSYVRLQGTLEVVSSRQDKRARGRILEANMEIERGAKVGPLITKFRNVPPVPPKVDLQSTIVAMLTKDQLIGEKGEVVFIAAGKGSGVEIGNRMYVVRRGDAKPNNMDDNIGRDDRRFPARALGEIVVVEVGETISVGVVTLSVQEMSIGDIVMMQRQAAP